MIPEIVKRAWLETVVDIGQLSRAEKAKAVKRGWLARGKGGAFPRLKTVYAVPTFDFAASRKRYVEQALALARLKRAGPPETIGGTGNLLPVVKTGSEGL